MIKNYYIIRKFSYVTFFKITVFEFIKNFLIISNNGGIAIENKTFINKPVLTVSLRVLP